MPSDAPDPARPNRHEVQHHAARGAAWTMLATGITIPAAFVANVVLARVLGVEGYGRLAFLTAALELVVALVDVGTTAAVVQFGSRAHATGRVEQVRRILARAQGFRLLVVAPVLSVFLLVVVEAPLPVLIGGVLLGVWTPAALAGINDCLTLENRSATAAKVHLATSVAAQAVVVVVALLSRDADVSWLARLALTALGPAVALPLVNRAYRSAVLRPRLPRGLPTGFWRFALPSAAAGIVGGLVVSRSEVLLLEWLDDSRAVGLFALAFGVAAHVFGPANALTNPLLPAVSSLRAVDADAVRGAFLRVTRVSIVMVTGVLAVVVPVLALLIETIYGSEYQSASPLLVVLAVGVAASTLSGPVTAFSLSRLRSSRVLLASLIALGVDVALALALIPVLGVWGAAAASIVAAVIRLAALVRDEFDDPDLGWTSVRAQAMALTLTAPGAWCAWAVADATSPTPEAVVVAAILGGALWWITLLVTGARLHDSDRQQVVRLLPGPLRPAARQALAPVTRREGS